MPRQGWAGKQASPALWQKLKPLARQMRRLPTRAEQRLWHYLRRGQRRGYKFRRQHAVERFILDFYCAQAGLAIEVDGAVHQYTGEQDLIRQQFLEEFGLTVLRFSNDDVMKNLEGVLAVIDQALEEDGKVS